MASLLYASEYQINDKISMAIPSVGDILNNEDNYFNCVSLITATPYDMMVQLDDIGIAFEEISEWELFCLIFDLIKNEDLSLIFKNIDLKNFEVEKNPQNDQIIFVDKKNGIVIDALIHAQISKFLCDLLRIERINKKPANQAAKEYMLEKARKKNKRNKNKKKESYLEKEIVGLVNTKEFPYNYHTVRDISIYQFNASLKQIIKRTDYDNLMTGVYFGTVNVKEIDKDRLIWM